MAFSSSYDVFIHFHISSGIIPGEGTKNIVDPSTNHNRVIIGDIVPSGGESSDAGIECKQHWNRKIVWQRQAIKGLQKVFKLLID